jgi:uncharacterized membrane protein
MRRFAFAALVLALPGAAPAQQKPAVTEPLLCLGTEPFWNVSIDKSEAIYATPDGPKIGYSVMPPRQGQGLQDNVIRVFELSRPNADGAVLIVSKHESPCSDDMSDNEYPFHAVFIDKQKVLGGCCK